MQGLGAGGTASRFACSHSVLVIGAAERIGLATLRSLATAAPLGASPALPEPLALPIGYLVSYTLTVGLRVGLLRHAALSVEGDGLLPHPAAVAMVLGALGFEGGWDSWTVWTRHVAALGRYQVNVSQPVSSHRSPSRLC